MSAPKAKRSKYLFMTARLLFVAVGLALAATYISKKVGWDKLAETFRTLDWRLFVLSLCIFLCGQVIVALRWWLLLRTQSIYIGVAPAIRLHFLGLFYNNFMPSSVGGDIIRAWYVTHHTEKKVEAALSVFFDRVVGLASTLVIALFFYTVFLYGKGIELPPPNAAQVADPNASQIADPNSSQIADPNGLGIAEFVADNWVSTLTVSAALVAVTLGLISTSARGRAGLRKMWSGLVIRLQALFRQGKSAVVLYCTSPLTIAAVFALTVAMQMTVITGFWLVGRDIGIEASIKYYYVFFTLTWVLGAVPVSIGGAVVVEVTLAGFFVHIAGADQEHAATLVLCQRLVWMIASLPGGVIHLVGAHLPKDFSVDYDDTIQ